MNRPPVQDDTLLELLDDEPATASGLQLAPWHILIVDDDDEVHAATRFTLHDQFLLGHPLALSHAKSAAEARALLTSGTEFAVIMLDVVMETGDAGLALVDHIRNTLGLREVRIILRTGQPGHAPELQVFAEHDINDYRTKNELTRGRLLTVLMAALRSYEQLRAIAANRRGLEHIVQAVSNLMESQAVSQFADGLLTQIALLLQRPISGVVCAQHGALDDDDSDQHYVVGATGEMTRWIAQALDRLDTPAIQQAITTTLRSGRHHFESGYTTLFLTGAGRDAAIYLETPQSISSSEHQLLKVFAANLAACFSNVRHLEQLNFAAYHDPLTHLSNRSHFILQLDAAVRQRQHDHVVMLLDIDHFADINDGLGHDVGNALLVAVAARLEHGGLGNCTVARIGADVFGVLGPASNLSADSLFALLARPFEVGEHLLPLTVTLGECAVSNDESGFGLLKRATIALNMAKRNSHSRHARFSREMEADTRWRQDVIRHLRQDFHAGKLTVWYQPQIDLTSGKVVGIEALVRWPSDDGFVQPPSVFIPLAEYSGLIVEIGDWVLQQACATYQQLTLVANAPQRVSVNVSMQQFRAGGLTERVASLLGSHRVPANALELEITESVAMDEPKVVIASLTTLRSLGVRIAIDDFGTGYSSLSQLKNLPIDCLKIDRAFVSEIADGRGGMYAETVVALGRKLGLTTIAEGVETAEQAGFLRALGCSEAQGYFYGKPMPLDMLISWLEQRSP